jgi:hypothetical protein
MLNSHLQYSKRESLIKTNDEDDLDLNGHGPEGKMNYGNKCTNLFKNMVKQAINLSSPNSFSK